MAMTENNATENETTAPEAPTKKAPAKKAATKKTAAAKGADSKKAPAKEGSDARNLYLPALPEGFEYTNVSATGPDGASINVSLDAGPDVAPGTAVLAYEGVNLNRTVSYPSMKEAVKAASKAANAMVGLAKREAELAALREEALGL